jgi:hypothetical protein
VYIISPHPFAEVDGFVNQCVSIYHLDLARYTLPMKKSLSDNTSRINQALRLYSWAPGELIPMGPC